jgi:hypothetical protein
MNLSVLEEWIETANLPRGVMSHLAPVRDLLNWLQVRCLVIPCCCHAHMHFPEQCLSSIAEFSDLVVTIQTLKHLNPLQVGCCRPECLSFR